MEAKFISTKRDNRYASNLALGPTVTHRKHELILTSPITYLWHVLSPHIKLPAAIATNSGGVLRARLCLSLSSCLPGCHELSSPPRLLRGSSITSWDLTFDISFPLGSGATAHRSDHSFSHHRTLGYGDTPGARSWQRSIINQPIASQS